MELDLYYSNVEHDTIINLFGWIFTERMDIELANYFIQYFITESQ